MPEPVYYDPDTGQPVAADAPKVYYDPDTGEQIGSESSGMLSRFVEGVKRNANPMTILSGIGNAIADPAAAYESLINQSAENFTEAGKQFDAGDYGHAVHHGIAGILPPYNIVTNAADSVREGNIVGGMGEAVGGVVAGKGYPAAIRSGVPAVVRGANRAAVAGANVMENQPALAATVGAGVGYMQGGIPGALTGAMGGGLTSRLIKALSKEDVPPPAPPAAPWGQRSAPVHGTRPLGPAQSVNETGIAHGPAAPAGVIDTRMMHGPAPGVIQAAPPSRQLTAGARQMPASSVDASYVRSIPAKYGEPMEAVVPPLASPAPMAPPPAAPSIPAMGITLPKMTKVDVQRITALDKELGAASAARALRHDPRFARMSVAERTEVVRKISSETPHTLPAAAAREIDAKFAAVEPAKRFSYVASWADVNPAVYAYLQQKLVGK